MGAYTERAHEVLGSLPSSVSRLSNSPCSRIFNEDGQHDPRGQPHTLAYSLDLLLINPAQTVNQAHFFLGPLQYTFILGSHWLFVGGEGDSLVLPSPGGTASFSPVPIRCSSATPLPTDFDSVLKRPTSSVVLNLWVATPKDHGETECSHYYP